MMSPAVKMDPLIGRAGMLLGPGPGGFVRATLLGLLLAALSTLTGMLLRPEIPPWTPDGPDLLLRPLVAVILAPPIETGVLALLAWPFRRLGAPLAAYAVTAAGLAVLAHEIGPGSLFIGPAFLAMALQYGFWQRERGGGMAFAVVTWTHAVMNTLVLLGDLLPMPF